MNATNVGSDMAAVTPMLDQIVRRAGQLPESCWQTPTTRGHAAIVDARARGVDSLISVPKRRARTDERDRRSTDPDVVALMKRMGEPDAKELSRARAGLCEWTNAQVAGCCGVRQFLVRGIQKLTSAALIFAITVNLTPAPGHARALTRDVP